MCYHAEVMYSRPLFTSLASLLLLASACGDDGKETSATAATEPGSTSGSPTTDTPTTSTTDPGTSSSTTDDTTSTTEPPTTTEPGTTGQMGCAAPADGADEDGDGIANMVDNCRCDPNPNQLDFDENAVGNACDMPLRFGIVSGTPPDFNKLTTTASAEMTLSCNFPVDLIVIGGELQVALDDNGLGKIYAASLSYADTPELECDLVIVNVKLKIEDLITTGDMPLVVGFPFMVADHMAGMVTGMMDAAHTIIINGTINVTQSSNPDLAMPGPQPLMDVMGAFPAGVVTVTKANNEAQIVFDDDNSTVFEQTTRSGITIKLTGLKGTLKMTM
jgi:hypothetical protein